MSTKKKIFITRPDLPQSALDLLKDSYCLEIWPADSHTPRDVLLQKIKGQDGLIINSSNKVDKEFLDAAGDQLKVISTMSVGLDHINIEEVKKRNIRIGYTPGVLDDAVAELTIALLLATTRRLFEGRVAILNNEWKDWAPWSWLNGVGLKNSVVGIFGYGRIGQEVARRLVPFKVKKILYCSRSVKDVGIGTKVEFDELLTESDIIIILCSLNDETKNKFGEAEFNKMKKSAILVNTSRGGVIDQPALIKALRKKTIAAAGLDVMVPEPITSEHELLTLPNCVVIPHLGSAVTATRIAMGELTVQNVIGGLENGTMPAEV